MTASESLNQSAIQLDNDTIATTRILVLNDDVPMRVRIFDMRRNEWTVLSPKLDAAFQINEDASIAHDSTTGMLYGHNLMGKML